MQLQIECNPTPFQKKPCLLCNDQFEMAEAKVILCNDQGKYYGEVCPHCLKKGFHWMSNLFDQLHQSRKKDIIQHSRNRKVSVVA